MGGCAGGCSGCGGCNSCGGCGGGLTLLPEELALLRDLAACPFLPVGLDSATGEPVYLENGADAAEEYSRAVSLLEKRGLIGVDYGIPLDGFDYTAYARCSRKGSIALTARGQSVVELLDVQGAAEE